MSTFVVTKRQVLDAWFDIEDIEYASISFRLPHAPTISRQMLAFRRFDLDSMCDPPTRIWAAIPLVCPSLPAGWVPKSLLIAGDVRDCLSFSPFLLFLLFSLTRAVSCGKLDAQKARHD